MLEILVENLTLCFLVVLRGMWIINCGMILLGEQSADIHLFAVMFFLAVCKVDGII